MLRDELYLLCRCLRDDLRVSDEICARAGIWGGGEGKKWRCFEVQWRSLKHKVCGFLLFRSLRYLLPQSFGTNKRVRTEKGKDLEPLQRRPWIFK